MGNYFNTVKDDDNGEYRNINGIINAYKNVIKNDHKFVHCLSEIAFIQGNTIGDNKEYIRIVCGIKYVINNCLNIGEYDPIFRLIVRLYDVAGTESDFIEKNYYYILLYLLNNDEKSFVYMCENILKHGGNSDLLQSYIKVFRDLVETKIMAKDDIDTFKMLNEKDIFKYRMDESKGCIIDIMDEDWLDDQWKKWECDEINEYIEGLRPKSTNSDKAVN